MIKADQLAEAQRAEQERKEKRQKAIEGYIAQFDATVAAADPCVDAAPARADVGKVRGRAQVQGRIQL
jgi:hypothetical protein